MINVKNILLNIALIFFISSPVLSVKTARDLCNEVDVNGKQIIRLSTLNASELAYKITDEQYKGHISKGKSLVQNNQNLPEDQLLQLQQNLLQQQQQSLLQTLNNGCENYWENIELFSCGLDNRYLRSKWYETNTDPFLIPQHDKKHYGLVAFKEQKDNHPARVLISFQGTPEVWSLLDLLNPYAWFTKPSAWSTNLSINHLELHKFHPKQEKMEYVQRFFADQSMDVDKLVTIHRGFFQTSLSAQEEIFNIIDNFNINKNTEFILTGHSLGAALTSIFAAPLLEKLKEKELFSNNIFIINYGSPKVFNKKSSDIFHNKLGANNLLRIVSTWKGYLLSRNHDPVTVGPPGEHVGDRHVLQKSASTVEYIFPMLSCHDMTNYKPVFEDEGNI